MSRVIPLVCLFAVLSLLTALHSAAPHRPATPEAERKVRELPLVERLYAEIDFDGFDDPKLTLLEALGSLSKSSGVTIDIRDTAFKYEMLNDVGKVEVANPDPIFPMKARLCDVLQKILNRIAIPSGATWLMRDERIEITTGKFAEHEVMGKQHLEGDEPDVSPVALAFLPLVNADFRNTPLAEALETLLRRTSQNIVLDQNLAKKQGEARVTARLRNVRVDTAILLLASQADLFVAKLDNVYLVSTEEKVAKLEKRHSALRPSPPKRQDEKIAPNGPDLRVFPGSGIPLSKPPKK